VRARLLVCILAAALVAGACSSKVAPSRAAPSPTSTSATPTPPTPTPPKPSKLSGRLGKPDGPILAVKIDNTRNAHPQVGLTKADVVYVEQVEGGATRLVALFSSELPRLVGPVRSARITDIELLRQYGTVGLAYSGAQRKLIPKLHRADLKLVSFDDNPRGYARSRSRPAPYNVIGTTVTLLERAGKVDRPTRVGYVFGPAPAGGSPATSVSLSYAFARVGAVWSPSTRRWLLSMDGRKDLAAEGGQLGATTFVVQYVTVTGSAYKDVNGVVTPFSRTVGSGKALVLRDGKVYAAQWRRAKATDPTTYTIGGKPAVFAPGQVWISLIGRDRPVRVA
jgi:hypothetical protein